MYKHRILFIGSLFILTGALCAPFAFAQSVDQKAGSTESQKQIQDLLKQIQVLQQQVATLQAELGKQHEETTATATQPESTPPELTRTLSRGSSGDDVRKLQEFLAKDKEIYPEGLLTGFFGLRTEAAVKRWQEKHELKPLGIVGPKTITKFQELGRGVVRGLMTEGAGSSGIIPPGLLTAPGIQKKLEVSTTATPSMGTATTTGTIPGQPIGRTGTTTVPAMPISSATTTLMATTSPSASPTSSSSAPPPSSSSSNTPAPVPSSPVTSSTGGTATTSTATSTASTPPPPSPSPAPSPTPTPATLSSCTSVDFEDDPYSGSNVTNVPSHTSWMNSKGLDITGTPTGLVWTTRMSGAAGQTGVVVGFVSPEFSGRDQGISGSEVLAISLLNQTPGTVTLTVASTPALELESMINNQPSTVIMDAFNAAGTLLGSATKTFTGVTNGVYTPSTVTVSASQATIKKVTLRATQHPYGGVWIEKVACEIGTSPDTSPPSTPAGLTATVSATTQSPPPPLSIGAPTNLIGVNRNAWSIDLSWSAPGDSTGITNYAIYRNNAHIADVAANSYSFSDVNVAGNGSGPGGVTYTYYVKSYDGQHYSNSSNLASITNTFTSLACLSGSNNAALQYNIPGYVTTVDGNTYTDACLDRTILGQGANLKKAYCDGDSRNPVSSRNFGISVVDCAYGCSNGTCNSAPTALRSRQSSLAAMLQSLNEILEKFKRSFK